MSDGKCPSCRQAVFGPNGEVKAKEEAQQNNNDISNQERIELPTGLKTIGILALIYGIWNSLFSPFILFKFTGIFARPGAKVFIGINMTMAIYMILVSTGLLRRKEWGRKGIMYGLILGYSFLLCHVISFIALIIIDQGFGLYIFVIGVPLIIVCGAILILLILFIRYLNKLDTKNIFV